MTTPEDVPEDSATSLPPTATQPPPSARVAPTIADRLEVRAHQLKSAVLTSIGAAADAVRAESAAVAVRAESAVVRPASDVQPESGDGDAPVSATALLTSTQSLVAALASAMANASAAASKSVSARAAAASVCAPILPESDEARLATSVERLRHMDAFSAKLTQLVSQYVRVLEESASMEQQLARLFIDESERDDFDDALRLSLTSAGERLSKRSEDTTTRVVPPLAGLHAFVETFHRKAVADAKQSARREANTRCEVNVYRERIADLAKREAAAAADAAQSHTDAPTSINATAQVQQATATSLSPTSPTNTWLETHLPSAMIPSSHSPSVQRELCQQACERHSLLATETNDKVKMLRWKLSTDLPVKLTAVCRDEGKSSGDEVVLMD